jgi:hypothetical protein
MAENINIFYLDSLYHYICYNIRYLYHTYCTLVIGKHKMQKTDLSCENHFRFAFLEIVNAFFFFLRVVASIPFSIIFLAL